MSYRRKATYLVFLAALVTPHTNAAEAESHVIYRSHEWRIAAQEATVTEHLGRSALALSGGRLWLDTVEFSDGVIEFDVAYAEQQGFVGPIWRAESDNRFEEIYFRSHLNGKPDAVQYTPVENGNSAWQIFSDANAIAAIDQSYETWNRAKVVVEGDRADFYFNSKLPKLHIPDLKTDITAGRVGLRVSGRSGMTAYFSDITIRPLRKNESVVSKPKSQPPLPEGVVQSWNVSSVFREEVVANQLVLSTDVTSNLRWMSIDAETNGIANLSKKAARLEGNDSTVFIRKNIRSARKQMKELHFGYSDRVRIYLNGQRVYFGDAGWKTRDYRFLGTVGFFDSVGLDLKRGDNDLLVAVSETFGGWAWAGAIRDRTSIELLD